MIRQKVFACVVTYNRPKLLEQSLEAIINQNAILKDKIKLNVLIWDNSDRDPKRWQTRDTIQKIDRQVGRNIEITSFSNRKSNKDASFGFYNLVKYASEIGENNDLIWIMDDDTVPDEDALHELIKVYNEDQPAFVNSFVEFKNTKEPFYKNIPRDADTNEDLFDRKDTGVYPINFGTFTSMMTSVLNVQNAGLPQKEFHIWGDDTEFSERLIRITHRIGELVTSSIVHHMTKNNDKTVWELYPIKETRMENFYYGYRNRVIASRRRGGLKSMFGTIKRELGTIDDAVRNIIDDSSLNKHQKKEKLKEIYKYPIKGTLKGIFTDFDIAYPDHCSSEVKINEFKY